VLVITAIPPAQKQRHDIGRARHGDIMDYNFGALPDDPILNHHFNNLNQNKFVENDDGSISTVYTRQIDVDGVPTLIPSVWDGEILGEPEARNRALETGINWPTAETHEMLRNYDIELHKYMKPPANIYSGVLPNASSSK
tara:strand:+ start:3534 stop:3953 length:420 start_codon:yes stop_codon:yes gene_type:complete